MSKKQTGNLDGCKPAATKDQKNVEPRFKVLRLEDLQKRKKQIDEGKYIKAILDMVRHYK
jgi:hypothetical protein